jgi:hypothetical protein
LNQIEADASQIGRETALGFERHFGIENTGCDTLLQAASAWRALGLSGFASKAGRREKHCKISSFHRLELYVFMMVVMGFAVWIDARAGLAWAQGTHEYRPMGTAVVAWSDQFRQRDFQQARRRPAHLEDSFAGFFGSLEDLNAMLRARARGKNREWKTGWTPGHLR